MYLQDQTVWLNPQRHRSSAATTEDVRERIIAMTPLGRLARPDDIAGGVALLASDMAGFITGQCLHVDGGLTMR